MNAARMPDSKAGSRHAIAAAALLATFMQSINISIPNAAVLHMQGSLSMSNDEIGWVFTAYIAASAIVMPITNWLAGRYGRKMTFQTSIALFIVGLLLNTLAETSLQFVLARILQGAASGTLAPLALAILLDKLPPQRHAAVGMAWTVTSLLGIVSGPGIGGWLSEYYGWHSIFHVSLPLAGYIFLVMALCLKETKADKSAPFDFFGLATFSMGIAGLQMLLDRGERMEWFASAEIWVEASAAALGFYLYIVHVLTREEHFLNKALFKDLNFGLSTIMFFAFGFVLLPTLALTSPMLVELLHYPADTAGYVAIPRGIALVGALVLAWRAPTRIDNRLFVVAGMGLVVYGNYWMLGYSPLMDWWPVAAAGFIQGAGLGILMPALTRAAFSTLDPKYRPEGTLLFSLARLYGGTIGVSIVQIFFYTNAQSMHLALAKNLTPYGAIAHATGPLSGHQLAHINEMVSHQAAFIAIIGQFKLLMIAMLIVSPLVLFLRKPPQATDIRGAAHETH